MDAQEQLLLCRTIIAHMQDFHQRTTSNESNISINLIYRLLLSEIPEVEEEFKKNTFNYTDKHKKWLIKTMRKLDMFVDIEDWALHRIIYSFNKKVLDKGAVIFKP